MQGFTLIELVAVIVLAGILIFSVSSRYSGTSITLAAQTEQLAADIRYAQSLSMTRGVRHCIFFDTASARYDLRKSDCSLVSNEVEHPATGVKGYINLNSVTLTAANLSGNYVEFDSRGKPYTLTPPNGIVALSAGGETRSINISPETGRVIVP